MAISQVFSLISCINCSYSHPEYPKKKRTFPLILFPCKICFFKASKSFLKLGSGFQSRSYGAMVSHTTIVFTRYIILEWLRRNQNDEKTYGELFFMYCEDIQNMDLTNALQSLMALFVEHMSTLSADITSVLKSKVTEWIASQARFIQALLESICWES